MKRVLSLACALLTLTASAAAAAGLNLGWGAFCPSTASSLVDETDPCDNIPDHTLVGSCVAPAGLTQVSGIEVYLDMEVAAPTLPDFWHMEDMTYSEAGCRDGSLYMDATFAGFSTAVCKNYWGSGSAFCGFRWYPAYDGPNRAHLAGCAARAAGTLGPWTADTEYYLFKAIIDGNHAVADPANGITQCDGCNIPACWVFNQATLFQPVGLGDAVVTNAATRQFVTWQGGAGTICPQATPARRATWGRIKSLYR